MLETFDMNKTWSETLELIKDKLNKPIYETILSSTRPISIDEGVFIIAVPTQFSHDYLHDKKCDLSILEAINVLLHEKIRAVKFVIIPKEEAASGDAEIEEKEDRGQVTYSQPKVQASFLNPRYSFDSFVVGNSNRFAHAAAYAVAESPGKVYNPLFLYGGVGLGKTHLMQAIGARVIKANPNAKVVYITSEKFTNELIHSIQHNTMAQFRNKYRNVDVLMLDDVQFITGKERTQEEFFHTFNTLYESSKQIIISNDKPPKDIVDIEDRLRSRFEWGLIADVQPPDYETRIAILKKKAELEEIDVPDDVFGLIAEKISTNIRELEGALIKLIAHVSIEDKEFTREAAEETLKDILQTKKSKPHVTVDIIKKATADYYSLKIDDMTAKTRKREIATARQVAMYIAREMTNASLPKIGECFGGRDHTTVMHAHDKIKDGLETDGELKEAVEKIKRKIQELCV